METTEVGEDVNQHRLENIFRARRVEEWGGGRREREKRGKRRGQEEESGERTMHIYSSGFVKTTYIFKRKSLYSCEGE